MYKIVDALYQAKEGSISNLLRAFTMNRYSVLSYSFLITYWCNHIIFLFSILIISWVTLIDI